MKRLQELCIINDLKEKYVFLGGPRQSGKTILSKQLYPLTDFQYLNYDRGDDRDIMMAHIC